MIVRRFSDIQVSKYRIKFFLLDWLFFGPIKRGRKRFAGRLGDAGESSSKSKHKHQNYSNIVSTFICT
jgi:hypothetical protein